MADTKSYTGGCHCGAVRYEVTASLERAIRCNCSICTKTGAPLAFTPAAEFKLVRGDDALTDYQFGKKQIHHLFCRHCGIRSFARGAMPDGTQMVALNLNCLDDVDPASIPAKPYDGRSVPIE